MKTEWIVGLVGLTVVFVAIVVVVVITQYNKHQRFTVPDPPSMVVVSQATSTQIVITWNDEASNETSYYIYKNGKKIAERPKDTTSFTDYNVDYSTNYVYSICAVNLAGESPKVEVEARSDNPPVTVKLMKIKINDNGEDYFREMLDNHGEIYI